MSRKKQIIFATLLGAILLIVIFQPKEDVEPLDEVDIIDSTEIREIIYKYGIPLDDYNVDYGIVKPNQSLSVILGKHGLSVSDVYRLTEKSKQIFDVRKIKSKQAYAVFATKDSIPRIEYFVYEEDPRSYIVFDLTGDYKVTRGFNPVEWRRQEVRGSVESSLWMSCVNNETSPQLAIELANIFGWSIDFFGLQKKDEFRVVFEQEFVDNRPLINFKIIGASICHSDSTYYAIPFVQGNELLFYNEKGNSLEGAFLKAPLDFFRISSRFTNSRYHPVLKRYRAHHGVDYAAPTGTPVYAIGSGKVIAKGYQANGGGNYLKVKHNGTYVTSYMHLSRFAKGIKVGSSVKQKEIIGYVGSTGLSTGPHLDFRVYENNKPVNPLTIKSQPKKPVSKENLPQFTIVRDSVIKMLKKIPLRDKKQEIAMRDSVPDML